MCEVLVRARKTGNYTPSLVRTSGRNFARPLNDDQTAVAGADGLKRKRRVPRTQADGIQRYRTAKKWLSNA